MQTASSWTRTDAKDNKYLYNAANELNENTGWYEMFYRGYDPTTGRMLQVDPYATMYASVSTYNYGLNNPVMMNDPSGGRVLNTFSGKYTADGYSYYGSFSAWVEAPALVSFNGGGVGGFSGSKNITQNYGPRMSIEKFGRIVQHSQFGGHWENGKATIFQSSEEALEAGIRHVDKQGGWNRTRWGSEAITRSMHFDIKNPRNIAALTPRQLNKFEIGTAMLNSWTESDPWKPSAKQVGWLMLRMLAHNADAISFSINLDGSKAGVGLNATPRGVIAVLTGPDKGKRVGYGDASLSFGENLGVAAVVTEYYYLGPSSALKISDFPGGQLSSSFAVSPFGFIEIGNGYEISQADDGGYIIGRTREIGIAPNPAPGVSFDFNIGKSWLYNVIVD